MISLSAKRSLLSGSLFLFLAVLIGAFGAHGLKKLVTPELLATFETGVRYHFYHAMGLLFLGLLELRLPEINLSKAASAFVVGILLFSFNCYFYVLTGTKIFAMIVPVGGTLFALGWFMLFWNLRKVKVV